MSGGVALAGVAAVDFEGGQLPGIILV